MKLMTSTVRILLLLVFALFWGGLTFYTGFVVRISHDVLNDPMDGGLITQRVTLLLQYFAAAAVVLMFANAYLIGQSSQRFGWSLCACSLILAVTLAGLFVVHGHLDAVIDTRAGEITDRDVFTLSHRRYNRLTTVEWIASLAYLPITVIAWRYVDRPRTQIRSIESERRDA